MEKGAGFTHLHVSGLPTTGMVFDAMVEASLRRSLLNARTEKDKEVDTSGGGYPGGDAEPPAVVELTPVPDEAEGCEDASTEQPAAEAANASEVAASIEPAEDPAEAEVASPGAEEVPEAAQLIDAAAQDASEEEPAAEEATDDVLDAEPFVSCTVMRNKETNACKGYCFLGFSSMFMAEIAMEIINAGVKVSGCPLTAQISEPKDRFKKATEEDLHDLRIRRNRYQVGSKKKQHGHVTCSDTKATITVSTGRINAAAGTRGGKVGHNNNRLEVFENDKKSSMSGFACAKEGAVAGSTKIGGFAKY